MSRQQYARFGRQFINFAQQQFSKNATSAGAGQSSRKASSNAANTFFQNCRNNGVGPSMLKQADKFGSLGSAQGMRAARQQFEKACLTFLFTAIITF